MEKRDQAWSAKDELWGDMYLLQDRRRNYHICPDLDERDHKPSPLTYAEQREWHQDD